LGEAPRRRSALCGAHHVATRSTLLSDRAPVGYRERRILHIMARLSHAPADSAQHARDLLGRIVSMLVRMTKD
jgi:hypothetical protein